MNSQQNDIYYDQTSARSPNSQRHQQPSGQRQPSRPFDPYGAMSTPDMFAPQDQTIRYGEGRFDRMNGPMSGGGYGYDMNHAQSWNPNAFGSNNQFAPAYAATSRMKPQMRGRSTLPNVCLVDEGKFCKLTL